VVLGARHDVVAGGQFKVTSARAIGSAGFFFDPEARTNKVGGAFVQDEITLRPSRWFLTLGSKFEGNDYTGVEVQPTARIRWSSPERQTVWGAVSRAVRLPTRFDTDLRIRNAGVVFLRGNPEFESESVVAYEAGYRIRVKGRVLVDVAGFANRFDNVRSQEFPSTFGPVVLLGNGVNAISSGLETAATIQLADRWRLHGSYTWLDRDMSLDEGSRDASRGVNEGNDPRYFYTLRSYLDLPRGFVFDGFFRRVAARPNPVVPAYSSLDLRLGWAVRAGWELSLVGQHLLDRRHPEFGAPGPGRYEFERSAHVRTVWYF
jgi:iron complex outermembrane receptor protein